MHQEHNIPWNTLTSHFHDVTLDRSRTPHFGGITGLNRPTQKKQFKYFTQRLISTIRDFSATERRKYPPTQHLHPPEDGILFSDELRDKYPEYLDKKNQRLDRWIASSSAGFDLHGPPTNVIADFHLADVVKILIHENEMETVLMLASHPRIPLPNFQRFSHAVDPGFWALAYEAMQAYIFWNFISSFGYLASGAYRELKGYHRLVRGLTSTMDIDAHRIPHREFFGGYVLGPPPDVDISRLQEYLSHMFRLLYRYDMAMLECGADPGWEEMISIVLATYTSSGSGRSPFSRW